MDLYSGNYKRLLVVPILILVVSIFFATQIKLGMDFTGGTLIEAQVGDFSPAQLKSDISSAFALEDLSVRKNVGTGTRVRVEFRGESSILAAEAALGAGNLQRAIDLSKPLAGELQVSGSIQQQADAYVAAAKKNLQNNLLDMLAGKLGVQHDAFSVNAIGPSLGALFLAQAQNALIVSFVLIVILVFVFFRKPVISFGVMQSAIFDLAIGLGVIGAFQIPMSLATIAPLLMLIGYSVDTDIMLTDRTLKRKTGTVRERLSGAMRTGMTMTGTTIGAVFSLFIFSHFAGIEALSSISLILFFGLLGDIIATWITNAVIILWYTEHHKIG